MNPRFPIYIPSKGRAESRTTVRGFEKTGVPYRIIVEEEEYPAYAAVIDPKKILVLDKAYQRDYDPCDAHGMTKSKGSGPARNFAWDHAIAQGAEFHWIIDDNIAQFYRLHQNRKIRVADGTIFYCMEDFVLRYRNIALAGPQYEFFAPRKSEWPPYILNSRLFSCILVRNDLPLRWRARYNEDLDLSLRVLKAKWCTVYFNAFLQDKAWTQSMKGGNTDELYKSGTLDKSKMIVRLHPDVARLTWKFQRWHHEVDYRPFRNNRLVLRDGVELPRESNNFGMQIVEV